MEVFNFQEMEGDLLRPISIDLNGNKLIYKYGSESSTSYNSSKTTHNGKETGISNNIISSDNDSNSSSSSSSNISKSNNRSKNKWQSEGTDLERASNLVEALTVELKRAIEENNSLQTMLGEVNETNSVILEMLISERQRNHELEQAKTAYKEELMSALKTIIQLRKKGNSKKSTNE